MSKVSAKAEHLIRAALKGIEKNPGSWLQDHWVCTPEDVRFFRDRHLPAGSVPECGTSYCLGGWMMLYDGWRHENSESAPFRNVWIKGDFRVSDPYDGFLKDLVYGDVREYLFDSIFCGDIDMPEILARIDAQLEINFEEDCPCLTEADTCNLQGCPCGTHTTALEVPASAFSPSRDAMMKVIEKYVEECRKIGDLVTVDMVLADKPIMNAFAELYCAGEDATVHTVTTKANRRNSELRVHLEAKVREITQSRDRLVARNSELEAMIGPRGGKLAPWERDVVIRKLQSQVDELHAGIRRSAEFRKLAAKVKSLEERIPAMALNSKDLQNRLEDARHQLHAQKQANLQVQQIGRREGFQRAMAAWQKALDIVKKEEGL